MYHWLISESENAISAADSRYKMYDGAQALTASGGAFAQGIPLAPRFSGTGYDPQSRTQSDFGSNVYTIKEVSPDEKH